MRVSSDLRSFLNAYTLTSAEGYEFAKRYLNGIYLGHRLLAVA